MNQADLFQVDIDPASVISKLTWQEIRALRIGLCYETTEEWPSGKVLVNTEHRFPSSWLFALTTESPYQDGDHGWAIAWTGFQGEWVYLARNCHSYKTPTTFLELSIIDGYVTECLQQAIQDRLDRYQADLDRNSTAQNMHNWDVLKIKHRMEILRAAQRQA